ncbi:NUDIX hydrolase [Fodinicola feengrottensis]|uniref:NUDIX domain-containing protein n=2 Tax=Fodinicola feengrottensis TaxID=435914 RepID=A0ABP4UG64_9ACTN|nr:NUDIX hydrolase [Fodinicola feengrottensis]
MQRVKHHAYTLFGKLPKKMKKHLVRAVTPNYTVGSVVLLRDENDRLLMLRQPPNRGWSLPGGLINKRETPVDAAARELREETGVRLRPDQLTQAVPSAMVNPRTQQVDCVFTATVSSSVQVDPDPVEVIEAGWYRIGQLPPLSRPTANLLGHYGITS